MSETWRLVTQKQQFLYISMGSAASSQSQLPTIPREQWQEVRPSPSANRALTYGHYHIYRNVVTSEEIQEYSILFQSAQQWEQYMASFSRRLQEEHIVNSRFVDLESSSDICSCGRYAKVYTERIPLRLHEIENIGPEDCASMLYSVLCGFEKLFEWYGYFKPISSMIGIDCEARVKVWINQDFSQNFKHCPPQLHKIFLDEDNMSSSQDFLVWEIVNLFKEVALPQPPISHFLESFTGPLTFESAKKKIVDFAAGANFELQKFCDSLLSVVRQKNLSSKEDLPDVSVFDVSEISFEPIEQRGRVIYFVHPLLKSSEQLSSQSDSRESLHSIPIGSLEQHITKKPSILSTGITVDSHLHKAFTFEYNFQSSPNLELKPESYKNSSIGLQNSPWLRPPIQFNYATYLPQPHEQRSFQYSEKAVAHSSWEGLSRVSGRAMSVMSREGSQSEADTPLFRLVKRKGQ